MQKVFISYSRKDQPLAEQVRAKLIEWNYDVWMDIYDLMGGDAWPLEIDEALRESRVIVGLVTPNAVKSGPVNDEWEFALKYERRLLLLLIQEPEYMPVRVIRRNYIDFTKSWADGLKGLRDNLRKIMAEPAPVSYVHDDAAPIEDAQEPSEGRQKMLRNVRNSWIKGYLQQALHRGGAFEIDLDRRETAPHVVVHHQRFPDMPISSADSLVAVLRHDYPLLILGAPGSGKTIMLLQLADALLAEAVQDAEKPIPVVLNLSLWSPQFETIEDWIVNELQVRYRVGPKIARSWVENWDLLPLLDGLDEVKPTVRDDCVQAINDFHSRYRTVRFVVCSRIADYEALSAELDVETAVTLRELSREQIDTYLAGDQYTALRQAMEADPVLAEMAHTPFLLNAMGFVYQQESPGALKLPPPGTSRETHSDHLMEAWIERRFRQAARHQDFTLQKVRRYLIVLAQQLPTNAQFYIEELQPTWLEQERRRYQITVMVLVLVPIWIPAMLGWTIPGLEVRTVLGAIAVGVFCANFVATGVWFYLKHAFEARHAVAMAVLGSLAGLAWGVGGLLIGPLIGGGWYLLGKRRRESRRPGSLKQDIYVVEALQFELDRAAIGLGLGLAIGAIMAVAGHLLTGDPIYDLFFAVFWGTMIGIAFGAAIGVVTSDQVDTHLEPNQGIRTSARFARLMGSLSLLVGPFVGIGMGYRHGLSFGLVAGVAGFFAVGLVLWLAFGGFTVLQHLILRRMLARQGTLPLNLTAFLEYVTKLQLMRRVGGGYMFIHRTLQEYLAGERE